MLVSFLFSDTLQYLSSILVLIMVGSSGQVYVIHRSSFLFCWLFHCKTCNSFFCFKLVL
uniref:Uncharacterized protein n=1 Tax=Setaria italica TaxID=4555 RepID=K3XP57_SETIT